MILLLVQVCSQNHFCNPGSEEHCSCLERFNRRHQISRGIGFGHEPTTASFQHSANDLLFVCAGENQDLLMGPSLSNLACGGKTIKICHSDIQNDHRRLEL